MKYTLKCRFCNKGIGEMEIPDGQPFDPQMFADIRCSECEQLYGSYHDIVLEVEQKIGGLVEESNIKDEIKKHIEKGGYKKDDILTSANAFVEKALKEIRKNNKQNLSETQSDNNQ